MNQPLGIALIIAGVCFLILGMHGNGSYSSSANLLQAAGGERTLWYFVFGTVFTVFGLYFLTTKAN